LLAKRCVLDDARDEKQAAIWCKRTEKQQQETGQLVFLFIFKEIREKSRNRPVANAPIMRKVKIDRTTLMQPLSSELSI